MSKPERMTKAMTLRLPISLFEEVEMISQIDDESMSEIIRESLMSLVEKRRAEPEFKERLERRIEADQRLLERLKGES